MNSETCEKLSVFCAALFGLASADPVGLSVAGIGAASAVLALPAVVLSFRNWREKPDDDLGRLKRSIETDWRAWASQSGELDDNQIAAASAALDGVLDLIEPDPQRLMQAGRDNVALVALVVAEARLRAPADYAGRLDPLGASADPVQGDINARFLDAMLAGTLAQLDGDPAFEAALTPWFQRALLEQLADMRAETGAIRRTVEDMPATLAAQIRDREALIAELGQVRAQFEATESLIANFLELMIGQSVPPDQFAATLYANMGRWKSAGERLGGLDLSANLSPELPRLKRQAELARANEQIDEVWRLIEEIDRIEQDYFDRLEHQRRDIDDRLNAHRPNLLQTKAAKRDTAIATYRLPEAARAIVEMIDLQYREPSAWWPALMSEHEIWYRRGCDQGLNLDLAVAIEIARLAFGRASTPDAKGCTLSLLGISLSSLGERENGTERLEAAVAAHSAALKELIRERTPLGWAAAQINLGSAFLALGERESGTDHLEAAVAAYQAALGELTRERNPQEWALTQNNLGNALRLLGERESGVDRLRAALCAYRAALLERTRERVPHAWAMTQNNLGNVLARLGEREIGTERLEEAVVAYSACLEEWTCERMPVNWATAQRNLGNVLLALGERQRDAVQLEAAVLAFENALKVQVRERMPFDWAMTQSNLAGALLALGKVQNAKRRLEAAVAAYRAVLEEWPQESASGMWAVTQNNLGSALLALAEHETDTSRLYEAIAAFGLALRELTRERAPIEWAKTQNNLGMALMTLGRRESDPNRLQAATTAFRAALEVWTPEASPLYRAVTTRNLDIVMRLIAGQQ